MALKMPRKLVFTDENSILQWKCNVFIKLYKQEYKWFYTLGIS